MRKIFSIFVCFSESPNFNKICTLIESVDCIELMKQKYILRIYELHDIYLEPLYFLKSVQCVCVSWISDCSSLWPLEPEGGSGAIPPPPSKILCGKKAKPSPHIYVLSAAPFKLLDRFWLAIGRNKNSPNKNKPQKKVQPCNFCYLLKIFNKKC